MSAMSSNSKTHTPRPDVIIIGGGVIGLSMAWELAGQGASVRVLEQCQFGKEASWAGAGMLPPGNPEWATTPDARLRSASHVLWPNWAEILLQETGIDNGYSRTGGLEVRSNGSELAAEVTAWRAEGVQVEVPKPGELRDRFPALNPNITSSYFLPDFGQIRNPRHLKALVAACTLRGVDLRTGSPVLHFNFTGDRVLAVSAAGEEHSAAEFVVAGGAWSRELLRHAGHDIPIEPVRGQIVLLETCPAPFDCVIQEGSRYLVPRTDGRILIGSTEERVGFEKQNTAQAVCDLIEFACRLVPQLGSARFQKCWSGLRPHARDGHPHIGRLPGTTNLSVAAGHFRAGLQLSPITAMIMANELLGRCTSPDALRGIKRPTTVDLSSSTESVCP